jgi:glucose-induced degradation protein 8
MYYLISSFRFIIIIRVVGRSILTATLSDLNRLIMDYLVIEGYKSAAEEFSQEANLTPPVDFESIESRMDIREALQRGDVEEAITRVNDLNPEVSV